MMRRLLKEQNIPSLNIDDAPTYYIDDVNLVLITKEYDINVSTISYSPKQGDPISVPTATIEGGNVTYKVTHNDVVVPSPNGVFVPNEGGEYKIVYNSIADNFILKKTEKTR